MNKNLQSPTKLTEFAPLQSEEKQQSVGQIISKFFKLNKTSPSGEQPAGSIERVADQGSQEFLPTWALDANATEVGESQSDPYYPVDLNEGRSLPNVLKRISNLLALRSSNLQAYSDTDLKQYWMPDSVSKECYECSEKFTTFRRRHHCRVCGQIFCSQCCSQQIPGKIFGCTGDLRVCTYCCKVVLSYLQSPDVEADLTADLKALQENLLNKYGATSPSSGGTLSNPALLTAPSEDGSSLRRKISVGYQEEKFALGRSGSINYLSPEEKCKVLQSSNSLRNLFEELCRPSIGIPLQTHRYRLRTYTECFLGSELVDWLIYQQKASTRIQAAAICQALLEGSYIECLSEPCSFVDGFALYKLGFIQTDITTQSKNYDLSNSDDPSWIQQIPHESLIDLEPECPSSTSNRSQGHFTSSSSYMLDLNIEANTVYLSKPPHPMHSPVDCDNTVDNMMCEEVPVVKPSEQREFVPESGWHNASLLREENGEKAVYELLSKAFNLHEFNLLRQLLSMQGLSSSWTDIIIPLIHEIVDVIRPDKNHDAEDIDIRQYVQFKKVPGGVKGDSKLIRGIVCSKNIAHKAMPNKLENPKILILQCPLVYQRTEGRLMSLEPILMQEHEYLRHVVARIVALQPDIVLVQRNVSRLAQDLLRDQGMTLILNVKQNILERLSRCTQADIINSMDAHIGRPRLGTCKSFYLKTFSIDKGGSKTLMFFEGLPLSHLGGTLLLRGASKADLIKIKQIISLSLFTGYNWRLEKSYLMDEFAQPPHQKDEFFDDSKENSPDVPSIPKLTEETTKLQNGNKSGLDMFPDEDNDAEFFSKSKTNLEEPNDINKIQKVENSGAKKVILGSANDFSDPLLSGNVEDDVFKSNGTEIFSVAELPFSNDFKKALDDTILCISPYLNFALPHLETEMGKKSKLRNFFPTEIFFSSQIGNRKKRKIVKEMGGLDATSLKENDLIIKQPHPFITAKISTSAESNEFQNILAHFRACGGRFEHKNVKNENSAEENKKFASDVEHCQVDALDPLNHQRLAILFCSYSYMSNNAPAFCVKMVVYMEFYGVNDIPLGCFLERYCFRSSYKCASKSCDTPMLKHIRRFVHNGSCISLSLNCFDNEFGEDGIVMWSWCIKCQTVSPVVPMSKDTWSFSFAKYLELRFHGGIYRRRGNTTCQHSLHHDHYQYFGYKNLVASFKYTTVQLWEISLPPSLITINYNTSSVQSDMIDEIKVLALKGHDIFSTITEKLATIPSDIEGVITLKQILIKDQAMFKQKIEEVQLKLTSPTLESKDTDFGDPEKEKQMAIWRIEDAIIRVKRMIAESVEQWNLRLLESKKKDIDKKKDKSITLELDSPAAEAQSLMLDGNEIEHPIGENPISSGIATKKIRSLDQDDINGTTPPSPKFHHRSQSDGTVMSHFDETKKEIDKKTVKNILSQLLPSATAATPITPPFNHQEHYTLPAGVIAPIVVYETEPSSIVAYALNSYDYRKLLDELTGKKPQSVEPSPSPVHKRRSQSDKEKSESSDFGANEKASGILSFLRNKESKGDLLSATPLVTSDNGNHTEEVSVNNIEKPEDSKKIKMQHIEIQFTDNNSNFFCCIYYAERFSWLRKQVLPVGEDGYIRSLARCVQWNAQGGKSGSTFCKTKDDRFVLKEMPKSEIQLFLDSAHNYFLYMQKCLTSGQPTLLGKIVGIYQVIYKNTNTNVTLKTNLLVMENLFYNRTVTHKFDLKGSMRNRLVNPDNQDGEIVLLDENLLKMTCETPLYILPHSKAVLTAAIYNDTEFLSEQSVMDYSLLVGLDSDNKELVLGIIDYIRTFTWDKKLETMVKKSGLLGGQGRLPTIISPKEYRKRFLEAMHRYFLVVPDHWAGLGKGLEC